MTQSSSPPISDSDVAARLPLKPSDFHILLALVDDDRHGYAILQRIASITAIRLDPGNLYRRLRRLLAGGLVDRVDRDCAEGEDERRRYYHLSDFGRRVSAAEEARLRRILESEPARALARERRPEEARS